MLTLDSDNPGLKKIYIFIHLPILSKVDGSWKFTFAFIQRYLSVSRSKAKPIINRHMTQFEIECRFGGHTVTKKFRTILQIFLA